MGDTEYKSDICRGGLELAVPKYPRLACRRRHADRVCGMPPDWGAALYPEHETAQGVPLAIRQWSADRVVDKKGRLLRG
jgi:hypothetical protein